MLYLFDFIRILNFLNIDGEESKTPSKDDDDTKSQDEDSQSPPDLTPKKTSSKQDKKEIRQNGFKDTVDNKSK